jgi:UDP-N-acetylglucosamine 2-epimerase (non-hydrolysing)
LKENIASERITVTGNTVIDALHWVSASGKAQVPAFGRDESRRMVLITGHRRENFGDGMLHICQAINTLATRFPDVDFIYPIHLNPNIRKPVHDTVDSTLKNIYLLEPLNYLEFVGMMRQCTLVLTDSGGIQEEAPGLGKPVLVMRDTTERPEALDAGTVRLVGTDYDKIVSEVSALLDDRNHYEAMSHAVNPYGDGKACPRIVEKLK